ncbi:uncharacterized protein [Chironomus tepperi]|uniref:uncharacterized protein n=1 Tax=Chironomus tepperi TaxID=113505 RepID=UPI00391FB227
METAKSLKELLSVDKDWLMSYMATNPGANIIDNYMISDKTLKKGFSCATGVRCQKLQRDCKDPDREELRLFLLCFSCDRIFHQRCANVSDVDLVDDKTPWICQECLKDPLNEYATQFFKAGGHKLFLKDRLEKFTTEVDLQSPLRDKGKDESERDYLESFFDISGIEKSLHINFGDLQPIEISRVLGTKLINQRDEVEAMKMNILKAEQEKLELKNLLAKKVEENESFNVRIQQLEQTIQERLFLQDSKLHNLQVASTSKEVIHNPPQLSSTMVMKHPSHQSDFNPSLHSNVSNSVPLSQTHVEDANRKASKLRELSYSIKVLKANEMMEQITRELNPQQSSSTNNASNTSNVQNASSYALPTNENPTEPFSLRDIRKCLPKVEKFDGSVDKWLTFERAIERNVREGQYSDSLAKNIIRQALTGQPLERVDSIYNFSTASEIMNYLKISYGCSNNIVASARKKLLSIKLARPLTHSSAMEVTTKITSYMAACRYAQLPVLDMSISIHIHNQLDQLHQQQYYKYFYEKFPGMTRTERLDAQFEFLNDLANTLPMGDAKVCDKKESSGKNFGVFSTSFSSPKPETQTKPSFSKFQVRNYKGNKDDFKYEIRDKEKAPYIGYDLAKVNLLKKKCDICNKLSHFSLECSEYRAMPMDKKYNIVKMKGICNNCLLTTEHHPGECDLKLGCGFNIDNNSKCSQKHHITLHRGKSFYSNNSYRKGKRRSSYSNSDNKAKDASQIIPQAPTAPAIEENITNQASTSQQSNNKYRGYSASTVSLLHPNEISFNGYRMCNTCSHQVHESSQRTVKLFNTYFYGNNKRAIGYAIGDSAAEITLVKRELIEDLNIIGEPCTIELLWTDSIVKTTNAIKVDLPISGTLPDSEMLMLNECYAIDNLQLPPRSLNVEKLKKQFAYLRGVPFESYYDAIPCVLIGSRHAHMFEAIEPVKQGGNCKPVALRCKLGYTIYGGAPECHQNDKYCLQAVATQNPSYDSKEELTNKQLDENFAYACSIESLGIKHKDNHLTLEEKKAIEIMEEEMKILSDGSVELPLIWNRDFERNIPKLPNNFPMVLKRQLAHENKLRKNPEFLEAFNRDFKKLIDDGYVRAATEKDMKGSWPNINYIPISLVVNTNKQPIKTRIVYDASSRYQNTSLNDHLLMGPNLLVDMLKPLMKMRMNYVAFTADVKSMFHRIKISPRDQQCQRILWRESSDQPMQIFIQMVMLFGPNCSPFCSQYVKNKIADKYIEKFPNAANALKSYTYMDDLLTSEPTVKKAIEVATQSIAILKTINWDLIGFQSNSTEFLKALPESHIKREIMPLMTEQEATYTTKVLGLAWNPKKDVFVFQLDKNELIKMVKDCGHRPTKRDQCSTIARIFDANGFLAHCIIRGRILLQRSWRNKIDWDQEISEEENQLWTKWLHDLQMVSKLQIPRMRFSYANMSDVDVLELHTFCDAGKEAFATSSYFVATINSYRYTSLVMAKAKVAPIKMKSKTEITEIPRLELLSCLIAARLTNTILNLHKDLKLSVYIWTDSEVALRWIKNPNQRLPKFAVSPIEEILEITQAESWRHVDTRNNVADIATKIKPFNFGDINSEWFQGPKFLKLPQSYWPTQKIDFNSQQFNINTVGLKEMVHLPFRLPHINCLFASDYIIDLFPASITSNWTKLVRASSRTLKIYFDLIIPITKAKKWNDKHSWRQFKDAVNVEVLSPAEVQRGQLFLIRKMQRESYGEDYKRLTEGKSVKSQELLQLNVFLDQDGVMRISSRVSLPHDVYAQQNAPVVPRKNALSDILLFHYHYRYNHVCLESQVADFRSSMWMPQLRAGLQKTKAKCNHCNYMSANPLPTKMAALPQFRVDSSLRPFQVTGLDCAGPLIIYNYGKAKKVWILVFTCCMSRFIHLHLLNNMDTLGVLEAIISLWAAHGPISQFISDNGSNFIGASRIISSDREEMCRIMREANKSWNKEYAATKYCSWKFIPVKSPWFGGFYERLIKEVKRAVQSSTENRKVSKVELNIALQEAAHRINCRPLTYNSISSEDEEVLTPHHIAKNRSGWPLLPSIHGMKEVHDPVNDKNVYRRGRILGEDMARRFIAYYLPILTKRDKWFKDNPPLRVNDLVLLCDPNKFRSAWERAKIIKIYKSKDNKSRVADVQMPDGTIRKRRSVNRLAKLNLQKLA